MVSSSAISSSFAAAPSTRPETNNSALSPEGFFVIAMRDGQVWLTARGLSILFSLVLGQSRTITRAVDKVVAPVSNRLETGATPTLPDFISGPEVMRRVPFDFRTILRERVRY